MDIARAFEPNEKIGERPTIILAVGWVVFMILFWGLGSSSHILPRLVPTPGEVWSGFLVEWKQGAFLAKGTGLLPAGQLITSITTSLAAIFFASIIGLSLSYLSTISFFKAPVRFIGSMRVLSLTGISIIFVMMTPSGYWLKISVLTFSIVVFLVNSMLQVIDNIPQGDFDHARTLGMNKWMVLREVVIRGTLASAFDTLRMNAAMAWMMLTMVEGMSRSDGGIGIVLLDLARESNYAAIFAVQIVIFIVGLGQDQLVQYAKVLACPYTKAR